MKLLVLALLTVFVVMDVALIYFDYWFFTNVTATLPASVRFAVLVTLFLVAIPVILANAPLVRLLKT